MEAVDGRQQAAARLHGLPSENRAVGKALREHLPPDRVQGPFGTWIHEEKLPGEMAGQAPPQLSVKGSTPSPVRQSLYPSARSPRRPNL